MKNKRSNHSAAFKATVYLAAVIDWFSRYILSWEISVTLESDFCVDALKRALSLGRPQVFNTDQGSQFTSIEFTKVLLDAGVQISMDGKGRVFDNIFSERLWRSSWNSGRPTGSLRSNCFNTW